MEGSAMKLKEMETDCGDKYNKLSKEDKDKLIEKFKSLKKATLIICCHTACSCIQDVTNIV